MLHLVDNSEGSGQCGCHRGHIPGEGRNQTITSQRETLQVSATFALPFPGQRHSSSAQTALSTCCMQGGTVAQAGVAHTGVPHTGVAHAGGILTPPWHHQRAAMALQKLYQGREVLQGALQGVRQLYGELPGVSLIFSGNGDYQAGWTPYSKGQRPAPPPETPPAWGLGGALRDTAR